MRSNTKLCTSLTVATAMGAALTLSGPAEATILHWAPGQTTTGGVPLNFDINGNGTVDLQFGSYFSSGYNYYTGDLYASGFNGTLVTAGGPLAFGDLINGTDAFTTSNHLADYDYSYWYGSCGRYSCYPGGSSVSYSGTWNQQGNTVNGYLGFALSDGIDRFFGWTSLTMYATGTVTVNEVAYESCANVGIGAGQTVSNCSPSEVPEPSSLALLAAGALGIGMMKRRRKAAAA